MTVLQVAFERQEVEARARRRRGAGGGVGGAPGGGRGRDLAGNAAMLDYLQDDAGYSRVGHHGGGAGRYVDAHDWIVASFLQHDSRDHDPQLHIHNAILNRVRVRRRRVAHAGDAARSTPTGAAAGAVAERVMEEHLTRALGVRFATRPDGKAREVVGVRPEVMDLFSSRRRAITAKAAGWVAEFEARSRPGAERAGARPAAAPRHAGDPAGEVPRRGDRRRSGWTGGTPSCAPRSPADWPASPATCSAWPTSRRRAAKWSPTAVIETALAEVQAAKAAWTPADLIAAIGRAARRPRRPRPDDVRELLDGLTEQALALPAVQQVAGERGRRPAGRAGAAARQRRAAPTQDPAGARTPCAASWSPSARCGAPPSSAARPRWIAGRGQPLPSGSPRRARRSAPTRAALPGVLTSGAKVETLVGPAGTGKSFVVGALARIWTDPRPGPRQPDASGWSGSPRPRSPPTCWPAKGWPRANVTRWLATQDRLADGTASRGRRGVAAGRRRPGRRRRGRDAAHRRPGRHPRRTPTAAGAKLLLIGDHRQLAAVGAGGGMELLAEAGGHELTEVRRFAADWEGPASLRLRDGDDRCCTDYRKHGRLIDGGTPEQARASAARAWLADTLAGRPSLLIVGTNEEAARLSAELRAELVRLGRVGEDGVPLGRDGTTAGVGDLVQARRNGWDLAGWDGNTGAPINRETYRVVETATTAASSSSTSTAHRLTLPAARTSPRTSPSATPAPSTPPRAGPSTPPTSWSAPAPARKRSTSG